MKILVLVFLYLVTLVQANDLINISLSNFTNRVSKQVNKNIYIDEDINSTISLYVPNKISNKDIFAIYKNTITKNGFNLYKLGSVYYLSKKKAFKLKNYLFKLSYNCSVDFKKYLQFYNYKYIYLKNNNSFIVKCNASSNKNISKFLLSLDKQAKQVMIKFFIISYDFDNINEKGINYASVYKDASGVVQTAINALVFPLSTATNIIPSTSFYTALKFLNNSHDIKINAFPYVLAKNNDSFQFSSVKNIPYLVKNTKTDSNTVQDNNSYEYKDVGLKINGKASIYDNFVSLNLNLTIEDIASPDDSLTPSTNKRFLNSITNLKFNQVLLISGIKQNKQKLTKIEIPFLSGIPFLGNMFKYKYISKSKSNITIAIEVIKK